VQKESVRMSVIAKNVEKARRVEEDKNGES
jgi:hypothetical protein